jgi:hypothetical protein
MAGPGGFRAASGGSGRGERAVAQDRHHLAHVERGGQVDLGGAAERGQLAA